MSNTMNRFVMIGIEGYNHLVLFWRSARTVLLRATTAATLSMTPAWA